MDSYEKWFQSTSAYQEKFCKKKIGVKFGIYETINAWFDENINQLMVTVKCTQCGEETTVSGSIWRDWARGKGRHQNKCKNCEKIKKEQLQQQRKKIAEQKRIEQKQIQHQINEERKQRETRYGKPEYIGKRYGHLTVLEYGDRSWKCKCDCGFEKWIKCTPVAIGKTKTCGRNECQYHLKTADDGSLVRKIGEQFESKCAEFLKENGYTVQQTPTSHDYGVDLLVIGRDGSRCAFQLKHNSKSKNPVSPKAVMEVYAGGAYYGCDKMFVVSTTGYTPNTIHMAEKLNVTLLDGNFQIANFSQENIKFQKQYITINGITKSRYAWCEYFHTEPASVKKRMDVFGMTFEEAVQSKETTSNVYEINGKKHSLVFWCEQYHQLVPTITARLKQGMDIETALMMPGRLNGLKLFPDTNTFM